MGRNQRHKKVLREEKAKVKLKQSKTKFLPKGLNVTNTAFKIKPILVSEQLKQRGSDEILSKRKLNVKDLLSRLKHYNENVRHAACDELTEMVQIYTEEIIQQHLSQVCLVVSCLMQDKERKVRKAAVKSVQAILTNVPSEKLAAFLEYFSTNLRCAMTNIDKDIQEDSLLFLDCFISVDCGLITRSTEKFLPDFLSLISTLRSDSQPGRTLTLNLGSKMTSVAWRIKVLSRLHAVLSVILKKQCEATESSSGSSGNSERIFRADVCNVIPIYETGFEKLLEESTSDMFFMTEAICYDNGLATINKHIVTLVPLLYETWIEVMPDQKVEKTTSESSVLSEEVGALLTCITNTLYLLWQYVKKIENEDINLKSVFMTSEGQKFLNYLLRNFPYCHTGNRSKKSKNNNNMKILEYNSDPRCVHENLLICFLYLVLYVNCTQHNLKKDIVNIMSYTTKIFLQKKPINDKSMQCIIKLLSECFGKNSQKWRQNGVDLQVFLENAIILYDHGKINDLNRQSLFKILLNIVDNSLLSRNAKYQNWLSNLPNLLCQETITDVTISGLLELSKKNCGVFYIALNNKLPEIIGNLERLTIIPTSDSLGNVIKRNLAFVFYYVPSFPRENLMIVNEFISTSSTIFGRCFREVFCLRQESGKK